MFFLLIQHSSSSYRRISTPSTWESNTALRTEDRLLPWLEHVESCGDLVAVVELLDVTSESHDALYVFFADERVGGCWAWWSG